MLRSAPLQVKDSVEVSDVLIVGLGRIGLPLVLLLAKSGVSVTGVESDKSRVSAIKAKTLQLEEPELYSLLLDWDFPVTNAPSFSEIFVLCVPTPLTKEKKADLSCVEKAMAMIAPFLKKGNLVIIESTCPIGTTERIANGFPGVDFAYCPERVIPGNLLKELIECDRIVGGVNEVASERAAAFYRQFSKGKIHKTNAKTAEAVKLFENAYRNVNLAFANEVSLIAKKVGLCDQEVISLANAHPRVDILNPGPGVGGHCIPVDPEFLIEAFPNETDLLQASCHVNKQKQIWVERDIERHIQSHKYKKIAFFGLSYKADVSDFRNSPSFAIYESLRKKYSLIPVDPFYPNSATIEAALSQADLIVALVAHTPFKALDKSLLKGKKVLDYAGVFN